MNLQSLRQLILENAGVRLRLGALHFDHLINRAVEHVVNIVELSSQLYNMADSALSVSVVSGTQDYELSPSSVIRKVLHAERTDVGNTPITCSIIDFRRKNEYGASQLGSSSLGGSVTRPTIYFTRRAEDGKWHLGIPYDPGGSMTIDVYYAPQIAELSEEADVPVEVPEQHHELIAVRATIVALAQVPGGDPSFWMSQYAELRQMMEVDLESWNRTGPRVRDIRVVSI